MGDLVSSPFNDSSLSILEWLGQHPELGKYLLHVEKLLVHKVVSSLSKSFTRVKLSYVKKLMFPLTMDFHEIERLIVEITQLNNAYGRDLSKSTLFGPQITTHNGRSYHQQDPFGIYNNDIEKNDNLSSLTQTNMRIDYLHQCITFEPAMDAHMVTVQKYFEDLASILVQVDTVIDSKRKISQQEEYKELTSKVQATMAIEHQHRLRRPTEIQQLKEKREEEEREKKEEEELERLAKIKKDEEDALEKERND